MVLERYRSRVQAEARALVPPPAERAAPPAVQSAVVAASPSPAPEEEVLFSRYGTVVTPSFVRIADGRVFAVAHITSVDVMERRPPADKTVPWLAIGVGIGLLLLGLWMGVGVAGEGRVAAGCLVAVFGLSAGGGGIALGVVLLGRVQLPPPVYYLFLVSAGGEVEACSSNDWGFIGGVAAAVLTAIRRR